MKSKKELICYLISGGITTAVNYVLYGGLLFLHLSYIAANSIAWAGAVLTAYIPVSYTHLDVYKRQPCS